VVYNQMFRRMDVTRRRLRSVGARPSSVRLTRRALAADEEEQRLARRQRITSAATLLLTNEQGGDE
jgi:predicted Zn-dependent protease with MMP-like domain